MLVVSLLLLSVRSPFFITLTGRSGDVGRFPSVAFRPFAFFHHVDWPQWRCWSGDRLERRRHRVPPLPAGPDWCRGVGRPARTAPAPRASAAGRPRLVSRCRATGSNGAGTPYRGPGVGNQIRRGRALGITIGLTPYRGPGVGNQIRRGRALGITIGLTPYRGPGVGKLDRSAAGTTVLARRLSAAGVASAQLDRSAAGTTVLARRLSAAGVASAQLDRSAAGTKFSVGRGLGCWASPTEQQAR